MSGSDMAASGQIGVARQLEILMYTCVYSGFSLIRALL
jgi:hypothetical protein